MSHRPTITIQLQFDDEAALPAINFTDKVLGGVISAFAWYGAVSSEILLHEFVQQVADGAVALNDAPKRAEELLLKLNAREASHG
ncbi:MAG: hypothetical protein JW942_06855 [Opitutales bacterium]|nr:hypothetical protein [Opitutales bacterium]